MKEILIQIRESGTSTKDVANFLEKHPKHHKKLILISYTGQTIRVKSDIKPKKIVARIKKEFNGLEVTASEPNHIKKKD